MPAHSGEIALTSEEKSALMNASHDTDRMDCACQPVWDAVERIIAARLAPARDLVTAWRNRIGADRAIEQCADALEEALTLFDAVADDD